ncbi:unnamed protein product [Diabrotica balteata]|uniref:Major facilitator superfamily (MFS) profile domain-containing protein n=1 Tax=Diabrotica balteata TaxID=107213 RepID=A0A9N9XEN7_DIABA|nr:unnamed protein product [Diabrotica balteata]
MDQENSYFIYWATFSVNLYSLSACTVFTWSSPALVKLASNDTDINPLETPITDFEESWIASAAALGLIFGSMLAGLCAGKLGRKKTVILFGVLDLISFILIAHAKQVNLFYIARFIAGLSGGCAVSVIPSYVAEISDDANRGFFNSILSIMGAVSSLCNFAIAPLISIKAFAYFFIGVLTLFFITFVPFVPETPYHFLEHQNSFKAEKALLKLRKSVDVRDELDYLRELVSKNKNKTGSWRDIFESKAARNGLCICCILLIFQQFMGSNFFGFYMQTILEASGNIIPSHIASIIVGVIQVCICVVSSLLIDRLGRKILLITSSLGAGISMLGVGVFFAFKTHGYNVDSFYWLPTLCMVISVGCFNMGYGPIPWTICGELFSTDVKALCVSIASFIGFTVSFIIVALFPHITAMLGFSTPLIFFGVLALLSNFYLVKFVPETKGKSFEEIQFILKEGQTS